MKSRVVVLAVLGTLVCADRVDTHRCPGRAGRRCQSARDLHRLQPASEAEYSVPGDRPSGSCLHGADARSGRSLGNRDRRRTRACRRGGSTATLPRMRRSPGTSVFRIASMTKSFTAMAIMKLRDAGKLSLDDLAERHVPELKGLRYPTADSPRITVRHLLSHAEGFPEDNPWGDQQLAVTEARVHARCCEKGFPFRTRPASPTNTPTTASPSSAASSPTCPARPYRRLHRRRDPATARA